MKKYWGLYIWVWGFFLQDRYIKRLQGEKAMFEALGVPELASQCDFEIQELNSLSFPGARWLVPIHIVQAGGAIAGAFVLAYLK